MFTGIISEIGSVAAATSSDTGVLLTIDAPHTVTGLTVGDSIAVNGVCLTATAVTPDSFDCFAVSETIDRTSLGSLARGSKVNLERPMAADGRFDGHIVQGHVDGVGEVLDIDDEGDAKRVRLSLDPTLLRYVVEKGSITLDGTSLTITALADSDASEGWVEVVLIPHTLDHTVFGDRAVGDPVNVEVDVIAKYVERMTELHR